MSGRRVGWEYGRLEAVVSVAIPPIEQMSEAERDEMLGRLVLDAFIRHGFGTIPVHLTDKLGALVVPRIEPAVVSSIPDLSPEEIEELKRRVATPERVISAAEFRERVLRDLLSSDGD
jgi:hypothetical protein